MPEDVFYWVAHYRDGSKFKEFNGTGPKHGFAEIDLSRCVALQLIPQRPHLPTPHVVVEEGVRPIFFRRRSQEMDLKTGEIIRYKTVTVLGFQRTIEGRNAKSFMAFYDDGSVTITHDEEHIA
jgi:hypothetical protein